MGEHILVIATPDNEFVPESNPTTAQVVEALRAYWPKTAPWWLRDAEIKEAE